MNTRETTSWLLICGIGILLTTSTGAAADDKVVVVPLGGTIGNALASDVIKGKTFSNGKSKGVTGTLDLKVGKTYTNSLDMQFRLIPAGSFVMGSPDGTGDDTHRPLWAAEPGRGSDEHQHIVKLTEPFYMQSTEVTQGQWQQLMGTNPSYFTECGPECPVERVSWLDVQNFIDALNASEGRYNCNTDPNSCYSLPTEAQWEYSARAGTVTAFYSGDITNTDTECTAQSPLDPNLAAIGWYCGNANATTHPVAQKEPNNWGLYDMSGNVWEWCDDHYQPYNDHPEDDPVQTSGTQNVIRGGGWGNIAAFARSSYRIEFENSNSGLGFRLILPAGQ